MFLIFDNEYEHISISNIKNMYKCSNWQLSFKSPVVSVCFELSFDTTWV